MQEHYTTQSGEKFILTIINQKECSSSDNWLLQIKINGINQKEMNAHYIITYKTRTTAYCPEELRPFNEKNFKNLSIVLTKINLENNSFDFKNKLKPIYEINPTKEIGHNDLGQYIENKNKELKKLQA